MALIGNHYRQGASPATNQLGWTNVGSMDRTHAYLPGRVRGFYVGQACGPAVAVQSFPAGYRPPGSWHLSPKAGGLSSGNSAALSIEPAALLVGGITTSGASSMALAFADAEMLPLDDTSPARTASASFTIDFAAAAGTLITSGSGTAAFTFGSSAELLGILSGVGSAAFALSTNNPLLGADAGMVGAASWSLTAAAGILPADDSPPARTATATFSFSGSLLPYAIGSMEGSTLSGGDVLTADQVAAATVAALQSTTIPVNIAKVNDISIDGSGTSGDPWGPA